MQSSSSAIYFLDVSDGLTATELYEAIQAWHMDWRQRYYQVNPGVWVHVTLESLRIPAGLVIADLGTTEPGQTVWGIPVAELPETGLLPDTGNTYNGWAPIFFNRSTVR